MLVLGTSVYFTSGGNIDRNNITIEGVSMPRFNSAFTALVGGSIILGPLRLRGENVHLRNLGVDAGELRLQQLIAATPGHPQATDGLVVVSDYGTAANDDPNIGLTLENIICLCRTPSAVAHACLIENYKRVNLRNIVTRYGVWGLVTKCRDVTVDGATCYDHNASPIHPKANNYAKQLNFTGTNLQAIREAAPVADDKGVYIYAATDDQVSINITGLIVDGYAKSIALEADNPRQLRNVSISGIHARRFSAFGLWTKRIEPTNEPNSNSGLYRSIRISDATFDAAGSGGKPMRVDAEPFIASNIIASSDTAMEDAVFIAGKPLLSNIISCVGMNKSVKSGITIRPHFTSPQPHYVNCSGSIYDFSSVESFTEFAARRQQVDGVPLNPTVLAAYQTFYNTLATQGIIPLIDTMGVAFGGATIAGAMVPMVGACGTSLALVSGDYNIRTGIKGNGSTKKLVFPLRADLYTQGDHHWAVDISEAETVNSKIVFGWHAQTNGASNIQRNNTGTGMWVRNQCGTFHNRPVAGMVGWFSTSRIVTTEYRAYDETNASLVALASQAPSTGSLTMAVLGSDSANFSDCRTRFWCMGRGMSDAQMLAMRSAYLTMRAAILAVV